MRLFIAIELPDAIKQEIAKVQEQLRKSGARANWTRPEGIHLTLRFLGEVEDGRVDEILQALTRSIPPTGPLGLVVAGAGAFPSVRAPRVLWLGVTGDLAKLADLQTSVEEAMVGLEFAREERAFSPHLTLARIRFAKPRDGWQQRIEDIKDVQIGSFEADRVSLMKSDLRREGAVYTEIGKIKLGAT